MHELSIALSIIDVATEEAGRRGAGGVAAVHLRLGALSGVVKEALQSAFGLAREGSPLSEAELVIEELPVVVFCPACQADREVVSPHEMCCRECGTFTAHIVSGRELEVTALELMP